ncbi:MAG: hypothetical protein ACYDD1_08800 [Caulobacteraceae bacterium]
MSEDCEELHARADMLHHEADHGWAKVAERGPKWEGYSDQVKIAAKVEVMAARVDEKIEEDC